MPIDQKIITAYNNARNYLESKFGEVPEDYMVLYFLDPSVYQSVILQTQSAGTPRAIISSNELQVLQHLKEEDFVASGIDLMYASRKPKIFFPSLLLSIKQINTLRFGRQNLSKRWVRPYFVKKQNQDFHIHWKICMNMIL